MSVTVLSRLSGSQKTVGSRTTPYTVTDAELVNDDRHHAALVRAIYNDDVSALSDQGQILKPEDIASKAFSGKPGYERWIETDSLAYGRFFGGIAALAHERAFMCGGETALIWDGNPNPITDTAEVFDADTRQWSIVDPIPLGALSGHVVAKLPNNKVLVAGGSPVGNIAPGIFPPDVPGLANRACAIFNGATNTWSAAAGLPSTGSAFCPQFAQDTTVVIKGGAYDGHVLSVGGVGFVNDQPGGSHDDSASDLQEGSAHVLRYNPTANTWHVCADMNFARLQHAVVAIGNGKVMVAGGANNYVDFAPVDQCEIFDSQAAAGVGTWTVKASLTANALDTTAMGAEPGDTMRLTPLAVSIKCDTQVLLVGGYANGPNYPSRVSYMLYTIASNTWQTLTGTGQRLLQGRSFGGMLYALPDGKSILSASGVYGSFDENFGDPSFPTTTVTDIISAVNFKDRVSKDFPCSSYNPNSPAALNGTVNYQHCQLSDGSILIAGAAPGSTQDDAFINSGGDRTCNNRSFLWEVGCDEKGNSSRPPHHRPGFSDGDRNLRKALRRSGHH